MTSVILNNLSLKYPRFTSFGCRNIGIRKLGFVAKTQLLYIYVAYSRPNGWTDFADTHSQNFF